MSARSVGTFKHLVLVGLSGSGKSTIGPALAARLARRFVDTDDLIVRQAGRPIPEIFTDLGEPAFREMERWAVRWAVDGPPAVIATGGGAPVDARNYALLWEDNVVVWLDAPVATLAARLGDGGAGRPLLAARLGDGQAGRPPPAPRVGDVETHRLPPAAGGPAARLAELRAAREPIYATAHLQLDTAALGPAAAVQQIVYLLDRMRGET